MREMKTPSEIPPDGRVTGPREYITGTGQVITQVHPHTEACDTHHCVIHNPSEHGLREMRTHWRDDRGIMERRCEHGVGHPDPDSLAYLRRTFGEKRAEVEGVHGCDGCCSRPEPLA